MTLLTHYLVVFFMSMVPVIELRAAVPYGVAMGLPYIPVLIVSILGNMVPVPFIILFIKKIFAWMKKREGFLGNVALKMEERALSKGGVIQKYAAFGLYVLVAIPLPGTGAWTGALVASIFQLKLRYAFPIIFAGVATAGIIMTVLSFGVDMLV